MTEPSPAPTSRLEREGHLQALEDFEAILAKQSVVPDVRKLLVRRFAFIFHVLSAVAIGGVVAVGTVFVNFVIFTKVLHL